jgi:hypothetical protein
MRTGLFSRRVHAALFIRACGAVLLVTSAVLTAALVAGCGDGGGGATTAAFTQNVSTRQVFRSYEGVASTAVRFTDILGQTHTRNFEIAVAIEVSPPLQAPVTAQVELNPFHFRVNSVFPGAIVVEGLYTIVSAALASQGSVSLVQFWRFVENGISFSGELIQPDFEPLQPQMQPQSSLNPTGNVIFLPFDPGSGFPAPIAFPLARGTRITGTMTIDHLQFRVEGDTADRRHPFISEVTATRVR